MTFIYHYLTGVLADKYKEDGELSKLKKLEMLYNSKLLTGLNPELELKVGKHFEKNKQK